MHPVLINYIIKSIKDKHSSLDFSEYEICIRSALSSNRVLGPISLKNALTAFNYIPTNKIDYLVTIINSAIKDVDEPTSVFGCEIELIMSQTSATYDEVYDALLRNNGEVVESIMYLTSDTYFSKVNQVKNTINNHHDDSDSSDSMPDISYDLNLSDNDSDNSDTDSMPDLSPSL